MYNMFSKNTFQLNFRKYVPHSLLLTKIFDVKSEKMGKN